MSHTLGTSTGTSHIAKQFEGFGQKDQARAYELTRTHILVGMQLPAPAWSALEDYKERENAPERTAVNTGRGKDDEPMGLQICR